LPRFFTTEYGLGKLLKIRSKRAISVRFVAPYQRTRPVALWCPKLIIEKLADSLRGGFEGRGTGCFFTQPEAAFEHGTEVETRQIVSHSLLPNTSPGREVL
jgi:hypothetical protein